MSSRAVKRLTNSFRAGEKRYVDMVTTPSSWSEGSAGSRNVPDNSEKLSIATRFRRSNRQLRKCSLFQRVDSIFSSAMSRCAVSSYGPVATYGCDEPGRAYSNGSSSNATTPASRMKSGDRRSRNRGGLVRDFAEAACSRRREWVHVQYPRVATNLRRLDYLLCAAVFVQLNHHAAVPPHRVCTGPFARRYPPL